MLFQVCLEDFKLQDTQGNNIIVNCIERELSKIGVKCKAWMFSSCIEIDFMVAYQGQQVTYVFDITPEINDIYKRASCEIFEVPFFSDIV